MTKKRQVKSCSGCSRSFITYKNYDYCPSCALNNSRYVLKTFPKKGEKRCPECGDSSGIIKFPGQPKRKCKICSMNNNNPELNEEIFWKEVEEKSKNLIASLVESNLPISAIPNVFNLEKDVDYRVLLRDDLPNHYYDNEDYQAKIANQNWTEGDVEYVAQELSCYYWEIVVKRLIGDLSSYAGFENTFFANHEE